MEILVGRSSMSKAGSETPFLHYLVNSITSSHRFTSSNQTKKGGDATSCGVTSSLLPPHYLALSKDRELTFW